MNGLGETNRPDWAWRRMASSAASAGIDMVGGAFPPGAGAFPFDDGSVSQAGGCGDRGMGGIPPGYAADVARLPLPVAAPAPTGTGVAGMLAGWGVNIPGPESGLYTGYVAGLG